MVRKVTKQADKNITQHCVSDTHSKKLPETAVMYTFNKKILNNIVPN